MADQGQSLQQQMQQQAMQNAEDFFGQAIGRVKAQAQTYRSQLEQFSQQLPDGDAKAQIEEMIDSYSELEGSIDETAQDRGIEGAVSQSVQQAEAQLQETAQQAQDGAAAQANGQVEQAQQATQQSGEGQQQEKPNATHAAEQKAQELGVDLSQVQGSGGRITVRDVFSASR